ncbi:MAG TPA: hypothetical protein VJ842_11340 [Pyrinomonadaceae bacterium]|nr:hypothetical protein [Pyrinomonadaceae bacterium]
MKAVIEVSKAEKNAFDGMKATAPDSIDIVEVKRFGGDADLIQAIVTITVATIPVLGSIISKLMDKKESVKIKVNGVEITGLTKDNVREILEEIRKKNEP